MITQLKKDEMDSKGYFLYDTSTKKVEFIPIDCRKFFYEELVFKDAIEGDLRSRIEERIAAIRKEHPEAILSIKLDGTLKEGLGTSDIRLGEYRDVYIDNRMNIESLSARLDKIRSLRTESLSIRELALKDLNRKTAGKITLFDVSELFEKLVLGTDEAMAYLDSIKNEHK